MKITLIAFLGIFLMGGVQAASPTTENCEISTIAHSDIISFSLTFEKDYHTTSVGSLDECYESAKSYLGKTWTSEEYICVELMQCYPIDVTYTVKKVKFKFTEQSGDKYRGKLKGPF